MLASCAVLWCCVLYCTAARAAAPLLGAARPRGRSAPATLRAGPPAPALLLPRKGRRGSVGSAGSCHLRRQLGARLVLGVRLQLLAQLAAQRGGERRRHRVADLAVLGVDVAEEAVLVGEALGAGRGAGRASGQLASEQTRFVLH